MDSQVISEILGRKPQALERLLRYLKFLNLLSSSCKRLSLFHMLREFVQGLKKNKINALALNAYFDIILPTITIINFIIVGDNIIGDTFMCDNLR